MEKCKCNKHPSEDQKWFKVEVTEEFGSMDTILQTTIKATCAYCGDVYTTIDKTPRKVKNALR